MIGWGGGEEKWRMITSGYKGSFGYDENVLKLDYDDGCTSL